MKVHPYWNAGDFCVAYGCPRNKLSQCISKSVSFHRFPRDEDLRNKWTLSLKLTIAEPTRNSVLCSDHFESDCFVSRVELKDSRCRYYRSLKKDAVPSLPTVRLTLLVKPRSAAKQLDDCENEIPVKLAKLEAKHITSRLDRVHRNPLALDNWNATKNSKMGTSVEKCVLRRDVSDTCQVPTPETSEDNQEEKDDDVQVLRVFESLVGKAEREQSIIFRSKNFLDSRCRNRRRMRMDRPVSSLDKTEDLEQHLRYKALLHENSSAHNSGYKNDSLLNPAAMSSYTLADTASQIKKADFELDDYSHLEAEYPSPRSADVMVHNAKYTTQWILDVEEKRKKSLCEELGKAEKTRQLSQHLHKHNEKFIADIEKSQWDWRSAFEIFKIEDEASSLPALTPQMEEAVRKALIAQPEHEKFMSAAKVAITRKDMTTLRGLNWLNDEIINCYMDLIKNRSAESIDKYPKVLTFNTFFYTTLCQRGSASLKRWNRKVDLFSYDMILAPIHEGIHWCLVQMDFRSKRLVYLDSMGGKNMRCLELFLSYFLYESKERSVPFNPDDWRLEHGQGNPKQKNGSDCGVFACTYAEFLSRDAKFTFDQSDMPFLRRKIAYEVLYGLLTV